MLDNWLIMLQCYFYVELLTIFEIKKPCIVLGRI